jgi:hypothetical protein
MAGHGISASPGSSPHLLQGPPQWLPRTRSLLTDRWASGSEMEKWQLVGWESYGKFDV